MSVGSGCAKALDSAIRHTTTARETNRSIFIGRYLPSENGSDKSSLAPRRRGFFFSLFEPDGAAGVGSREARFDARLRRRRERLLFLSALSLRAACSFGGASSGLAAAGWLSWSTTADSLLVSGAGDGTVSVAGDGAVSAAAAGAASSCAGCGGATRGLALAWGRCRGRRLLRLSSVSSLQYNNSGSANRESCNQGHPHDSAVPRRCRLRCRGGRACVLGDGPLVLRVSGQPRQDYALLTRQRASSASHVCHVGAGRALFHQHAIDELSNLGRHVGGN